MMISAIQYRVTTHTMDYATMIDMRDAMSYGRKIAKRFPGSIVSVVEIRHTGEFIRNVTTYEF